MATELVCKIKGCDKPHHAKGFCNTHYTQQRIAFAEPCSVEGCFSPKRSLGLCDHHYKEFRRPILLRYEIKRGEGLRFLRKVVQENREDCILWPFGRHGNGYASVYVGGKQHLAHRLVCKMAHGEPESENLHAAHSCGNGHLGCVNPKHLRWATASENLADRDAHGTHQRGEQHPRARLTEADVKDIRLRRDKGETCSEIAALYGVTSSYVSMIARRKAWASL